MVAIIGAQPCLVKGVKNTFEFKEYRDKELLTVLGPVTVKRAYYYDEECEEGHCPKDRALNIVETSFSPGVRRIIGRVGAYGPFGLGHKDIKDTWRALKWIPKRSKGFLIN